MLLDFLLVVVTCVLVLVFDLVWGLIGLVWVLWFDYCMFGLFVLLWCFSCLSGKVCVIVDLFGWV